MKGGFYNVDGRVCTTYLIKEQNEFIRVSVRILMICCRFIAGPSYLHYLALHLVSVTCIADPISQTPRLALHLVSISCIAVTISQTPRLALHLVSISCISVPIYQTPPTSMENKWQEVYNYLALGAYPSGCSKNGQRALRKYASNFSINEGNLFYGNRRAIQNKDEAKSIFNQFHTSPIGGHTGMRKTRSAVCSRFYWNAMTVHIDNWVLECEQCQKVRKPLKGSQPLQFIKVSNVWELVGIDLTGPLPKTVNGNLYILTATDYFSKWVEAFPLKTKTAAEVGQHLCSMIYRHGCPKRILSDQGKEFVNQLNIGLCTLLGIERSVTAEYHPQTNGLDEKTNDNIKRALMKVVNDKQDDWDLYLKPTLFSLRSKVQTTTKFSPFQLMYGREAVFPAEVPVEMPLSQIILPHETSYVSFMEDKKAAMEIVKAATMENISKSQNRQKEAHDKKIQKKYM